MPKFTLMILVNISSVLLLVALIVGPLLIAKNMAKVAGVKSESKYLVVSQVERFPNLSLSQRENTYSISYTKQGPSQAYIGVLIVNNPKNTTQTYAIKNVEGNAQPFFGEDLQNPMTKITVPSQASVPVSLFSGSESESGTQTVEFKISAEIE